MARQTFIYRVDARDVERQIALATVTKNTALVSAFKLVLKTLNIPVDDHRIKEQMAELEVLRNLLKTSNK